MKIYNTKLKSVGFIHSPEDSSTSHEEYVKIFGNSYKRISIIHRGAKKSVTFLEQLLVGGKFVDVPAEFTPQEMEAIDTLLKETNFMGRIIWDEKENIYRIEGETSNGND